MLIVLATIETTADAIAEQTDAILAVQAATLKEPGCISYCFSTEIGNPNNIQISEKWENLEALQAHLQTEHIAIFNAALVGNPPKSVTAKAYEVAQEVDFF